jgi:hypothetical protein
LWKVGWFCFLLVVFELVPLTHRTSEYSSVGRAGDCRWLQLISLGHWFDSGCSDSLFFFFFLFLFFVFVHSFFLLYLRPFHDPLQNTCSSMLAFSLGTITATESLLCSGGSEASNKKTKNKYTKNENKKSCVRRELNPGPSLGKRRS